MSTSSLDDLPGGERVLIDATIFVHHFFRDSVQCRRLLERCERREVVGITSVIALNEATHRLMAMEAIRRGLVAGGAVPQKLRKRPDIVRQLSEYVWQVQCIPTWGIEVLPVDLGRCMRAMDIRSATGLLTNDSLIVATMRDAGVSAIATADGDFARVEGLEVFRPTDLGSAAPALA
ncbi:MAG TPA: PIN domain-containing protein [Vicinamibacterales bacterium]|jgi:predicted nucleic acid-binding protein